MLFVACLIALGPVFLGFPARGFIDCFAALLDLLGMLLLAWPHSSPGIHKAHREGVLVVA